ncbi:unnamed protein product [Rotaria magnacalcarata]
MKRKSRPIIKKKSRTTLEMPNEIWKCICEKYSSSYVYILSRSFHIDFSFIGETLFLGSCINDGQAHDNILND